MASRLRDPRDIDARPKDFPGKQLLMAILERAILDIVAGTKANATPSTTVTGKQARLWIACTDTHEINCYERICTIFGIDPAHLRDPDTMNRVIAYYSKKERVPNDSSPTTSLPLGY